VETRLQPERKVYSAHDIYLLADGIFRRKDRRKSIARRC